MSGQSAAYGKGVMGYTSNQSQPPMKIGLKDGPESNDSTK